MTRRVKASPGHCIVTVVASVEYRKERIHAFRPTEKTVVGSFANDGFEHVQRILRRTGCATSSLGSFDGLVRQLVRMVAETGWMQDIASGWNDTF